MQQTHTFSHPNHPVWRWHPDFEFHLTQYQHPTRNHLMLQHISRQRSTTVPHHTNTRFNLEHIPVNPLVPKSNHIMQHTHKTLELHHVVKHTRTPHTVGREPRIMLFPWQQPFVGALICPHDCTIDSSARGNG